MSMVKPEGGISYDSQAEIEAQKLKNERKLVKFKEEVWRQDRKDRRAYLESISMANQEINQIHSILATRKNVGNLLTGDRHKDTLNLRIDSAVYRIDSYWDEIGRLNERIAVSEKKLLEEFK